MLGQSNTSCCCSNSRPYPGNPVLTLDGDPCVRDGGHGGARERRAHFDGAGGGPLAVDEEHVVGRERELAGCVAELDDGRALLRPREEGVSWEWLSCSCHGGAGLGIRVQWRHEWQIRRRHARVIYLALDAVLVDEDTRNLISEVLARAEDVVATGGRPS